MSLKDRFKTTLHKIRNPQTSEDEAAFNKNLGFKRLLFFVPFLIAALIVMLLAMK